MLNTGMPISEWRELAERRTAASERISQNPPFGAKPTDGYSALVSVKLHYQKVENFGVVQPPHTFGHDQSATFPLLAST